jgi:multimeric flavodoxin WrbA
MEKMIAADAILLGSPTYFTDVSAEMKALIDRAGLVALANGGLFRGKIGAAVVAVRRGGGTHAFDTINHLFLMSGAIVPGSTYWNLGFGLEKGDVAKDDEAARNMADLGKTISWLGKAIKEQAWSRPITVVRE